MIRNRTAAIVSIDDLKIYFKGNKWQVTNISDDLLETHSDIFDVSLKLNDVIFSVNIESIDDSSDSHKTLTDNPIVTIDEFFGSESGKLKLSTPEDFSEKIRILSAQIFLGEISLNKAASILKKLIISSDIKFPSEDLQKSELSFVKRAIEKKGWRVSDSTSEIQTPALHVNIADMYEIEIYVDSINWGYTFSLHLDNSVKKSGTTKDPISEFRRFYKDPDVQKAIELTPEKTKAKMKRTTEKTELGN